MIDHRNKVCDYRKALLKGHHECQYLDVPITFTNFKSFPSFLKQSLSYFEIYNENIAQVIRNMGMVSNNLKPAP